MKIKCKLVKQRTDYPTIIYMSNRPTVLFQIKYVSTEDTWAGFTPSKVYSYKHPTDGTINIPETEMEALRKGLSKEYAQKNRYNNYVVAHTW